MNLFKYYDDEKFKLILRDKGVNMRISQIYSLNDPFESRINLLGVLQKTLNLAVHSKKISLEEEKKYYLHFKKTEEEFLNYLNEKFGIISLTTKPKNKLMWSHYANSYKGFCIELDLDSHPDIFKIEDTNSLRSHHNNVLIKVDYKKNRVDFDQGLLERRIEREENIYFHKIMSTKEDIWEYEDEYRIIGTIGNKKSMIKDANQIPIHTLLFPASSIRQIILGTLCTKDNIEFVKQWINTQNAHHIKLTQLTLCESSYDLKTIDL
ncbi:DUF2971 domain-containing protein [Marinomonas sp. TW1]|uniref:DUF2971 domain-containing protein n=1 Tax=Marinomonas sp. TW1 TaxID=1561203 RepID=UPI0007AF6D72|nr:DUF2971 domain-containing protein [Marinomonas sp. TW1]KZN15190.1 hypothetical protein OA79_03075 [Marinomonas sp. TW1]